jgi:hypothetical protein
MTAHAVKLVVVVDDSAKTTRLEVPQGLVLTQAAPIRRGDAGPRMPIIVVGVALTASFVSAGLWLSRRGRNMTSLVIALALFALGSGTLVADIARPGPPKPAVELTLPAGVQLPANIRLQVTDKGDAVRLIVPSTSVITPGKPEPKRGE